MAIYLTFSPTQMWITGLNLLRKPFLHLPTHFNRAERNTHHSPK
ncbi:MAG: hypothetical protein HXY35_16150 [Chloroflexi bacterium]|nr:hypothetical protein [Chloroflexota bacterium]